MVDSVTVSILDDTIGIASMSRRMNWVRVLTAWRERMEDRRGTSSTSSNVSAVSGRNFMTVFLLAPPLDLASGFVIHGPYHVECFVNVGVARTGQPGNWTQLRYVNMMPV